MPAALTFSQINPFVRFAREGTLSPCNLQGAVCARDSRLFFLYEGACSLSLSCGAPLPLAERSAILLPAGLPYRFFLNDGRMPRLFTINFDYTQAYAHQVSPFPLYASGALSPQEVHAAAFSDCEALNRPLIVPGADALTPLLAEMQREAAERRLFFERQLSALMLRALTLLLRRALREDDRQAQAVDRMIAFIQAHLAYPLTNEEIAAHVNYHPVHANRLMRLHTGCTLHQYLLSCRLQRALELLLNSTRSITDVALETGFPSASRFTRCFREATGRTPSEFRRAQAAGRPRKSNS